MRSGEEKDGVIEVDDCIPDDYRVRQSAVSPAAGTELEMAFEGARFHSVIEMEGALFRLSRVRGVGGQPSALVRPCSGMLSGA